MQHEEDPDNGRCGGTGRVRPDRAVLKITRLNFRAHARSNERQAILRMRRPVPAHSLAKRAAAR